MSEQGAFPRRPPVDERFVDAANGPWRAPVSRQVSVRATPE
ncbi:hypothetical protein AvCA_21080 [Azotobacter vinelandii CA]|uniref:Uncharacterized protein n=2 Tax=Azotobacter vinelandii TaxID=354 RepID=C1DFA6_AZOVD|nr:hypothetical protein [Azotobacter vinelandii]ACO78309.1 hypothetical protein Avin_21080 [Azotobacter vinelandii DJ]AGK16784.1 hypothetical protein AvCA_21080 [Azotobacter vinelandii CA]AGK20403.1 hypothetical protein AvCA6_21080 [Azotobacter vinelandii CA6]SFY18898.1 hypothetical protein SAMN04244547_04380 [Azotobacter vinelandii]